MDHQIGFIGAGQMARALAGGFLKSGITTAAGICAYDVSGSALQNFCSTLGARRCVSIFELLEQSAFIFLAVKPQNIDEVLEKMKFHFEKISKKPIEEDSSAPQFPLVVSIAAGVSLSHLAEFLGPDRGIIRVMPNTPCLIGCGVCGFTVSASVSDEVVQIVRSLLETVGLVVEVPEKLMDAITGLSGSGPAFGYLIVEALSDAGVGVGLSRDIATRLAAQTLKGAAEMVLASGEHPAVLKDRVASPGGTTIAGLVELEKTGTRHALISAVKAATDRSAELRAAKK